MSVELIIILVFLIVFPLVFIGVWLLVITLIGAASGWKGLERRFPDRDEPAVETFKWASGVMGGNVRMNGVLTLTACPAGLRVAVGKMFGPSRKPFLVPWDQIAVERKTLLLQDVAVLTFGSPSAGKLQVAADLADRIFAARGREPERASRPTSLPANPIVS